MKNLKKILLILPLIFGYEIVFGQCITQGSDMNFSPGFINNWIDCGNPSIIAVPENTYAFNGSTNLVGEVNAGASLCQNITGLTPGVSYVLSFNYAHRNSGGQPATVPIDIFAPSIAAVTDFNVVNPGFWQWNYYEQIFTATATTGQLRIRVDPSYLSVLGVMIDNICIKVAVGPGGVFAHTLWLKANAGTNTTTNNTPLSSWTSQGGIAGVTVAQAAAPNQPVFMDGSGTAAPIATSTNIMNYNPYIIFDGSNDRLVNNTSLDFGSHTIGLSNFNVFKSNNIAGIDKVYFEWGGPNAKVKNKTDGQHVITQGSNAFGTNNQFIITNDLLPKIINLTGKSTGLITNLNRVNHTVNNTFSSNNNPSNNNSRVYIGSNVNSGEHASVSNAEHILFNKEVTLTEQLRVNSYLAVKYGITLGGNGTATAYLSADGTNIWNGLAAFHNKVIGIGRDDNSAFLQKQSHQDDDTVRLYLSTLAGTNIANTGTFGANGAYIMLGSNTGKLCTTNSANADIPPVSLAGCVLYSRIEREWRLQRTNSTETFSFDVKLQNCAVPGAINVNDLRLLVDNDDNFANGGTQCYYMGDGTGINFSYANPTITISGLSNIQFPNNSVRFFTIASANAATPLPVELLYFNAECKENEVELSWVSQSEMNNDYYTIDRSNDGVNFSFVTSVHSFETNQINMYSYSDQVPNRTGYYYRLSQTDFDGKSNILKLINLDCTYEIDEIEVYPVPSSDIISVLSPQAGSISILDNMGQVLFTKIIETGENNIEISSLSKGTYYVKAILANKTIKVIKIVKT